jgi:sarcosine oxidase subunit alpha
LITLTLNNNVIEVAEGSTVAAAIMNAGVLTFRRSVTGDQRAPLCGMGICFECRVTIDGVRHLRSCTVLARDGMEIVTDE